MKLAGALSKHHSQELCEFVYIVTSMLLRPMEVMNPPPPPLSRRAFHPPRVPPRAIVTHPHSLISTSSIQHQQQNGRLSGRFSTALAPLASNGVQLPWLLPRVSLLTLEFENPCFEADFHSWKAECMRNQDLWSLFACLVVIIASVATSTRISQLVQVGVILATAAVTAVLATSMQSSSSSNNKPLSFYRNNRDTILVASTLCIATCLSFTGGGLVLKNQIFALIAVLLPVRLRWHIAQLLIVLTWRIVSLAVFPPTPLDVIRLVIGAVLAPFTIAYVAEAVARRGFLSRQALAAAAAAAEVEYDDEFDEYDDEEEYDDYDEENDEDWLYE